MWWCVVVVVLFVLGGCCSLFSWEWGIFAHSCMAFDNHPERDRAREHMLGVCEATRGAGSTQAGGGCGCN